VEQEVFAAGDDEHAHGVREPGRPVPEGLDVAPRWRPDPDGDQGLDRAADGGALGELLVQRDRGLEIVYEDPGHHTGDVGHA